MIRWISWAKENFVKACDVVHWERGTKLRYGIGTCDERVVDEGLGQFHKAAGILERSGDDHLALREIAKIPTIDIIDFDYPRPRAAKYWHTTKDKPENCSALSLAKVGYVLEEWLKKAK